jgi:hypothetical protein
MAALSRKSRTRLTLLVFVVKCMALPFVLGGDVHSGLSNTYASDRMKLLPSYHQLHVAGSRDDIRHIHRTPHVFQSHDADTLRHILDCGSSCVYVGLESKGNVSSAAGDEAAALHKTTIVGPSVPIRKLSRKMHCPTAWIRLLSSCPASEWPPPRNVPEALQDAFTMGGRAAVSDWYFSQQYSGGDALLSHWSASDLDARIAAASLEEAMKNINSYDIAEARYVDHAIARYAKDSINNRVGVVWGSELPWVEVLLARHGAKQVLTVEYGRIKVDEHPVISATTPGQLAAMMLTHPRSFDFAVTFSSLEHSGLGRYGDSLNPYGDIEAAVQTWCLLRPGGIFLLGLPATDHLASKDELTWNAHRHYGPLRLAEMFAGYEHVETIDSREFGAAMHGASIVHVLRKPMISKREPLQKSETKLDHFMNQFSLHDEYLHHQSTKSTLRLPKENCKEESPLVSFGLNQLGVSGGFGDRLRGMVTTYYLAIMTNSSFAVDWTRPYDLSHFFALPSCGRHAAAAKRPKSKQGSTGDSDDVASSSSSESSDVGGNDTVVRTAIDDWTYFTESLFLDDTGKNLEISTNSFHWKEVVRNQAFRERAASLGLLRLSQAELFQLAIDELFGDPKSVVRDSFESVMRRLAGYQKSAVPYVGVQIRLGGKNSNPVSGWVDPARHSPDEVQCFAAEAVRMCHRMRIRSIFVTGDSEEAVRAFENAVARESASASSSSHSPPPIVVQVPGIIGHTDRSSVVTEHAQHVWLKSILDWWALKHAEALVISRSGFGETAALASDAKSALRLKLSSAAAGVSSQAGDSTGRCEFEDFLEYDKKIF